MIRNEADKFLKAAVETWTSIADDVFVLDDASDDASAKIARKAGAEVVTESLDAWHEETTARQRLWHHAVLRTSPGDWIFVLDADMVPARDPRQFFDVEDADALAFPLFDLWSPTTYRHDEVFWTAHRRPRIWAVRRPEDREWEWSSRTIHSGHFPLNLDIERVLSLPERYGLLHYAYASAELREAKHAQYLSVKDKLSGFEIAHARSILDVEPQTSPLPMKPEFSLCESS